VTTCTGTCAALPEAGVCAAPGSCTGECTQPTGTGSCSEVARCEANVQCKNVCALKGALAGKCEPPRGAGVRVVGDLTLYAAMKNHLPEFAAAAQEAGQLNQRSFALARVTLDDYKALGVTRDKARLCVLEGGKIMEEARKSLGTSVAASQVVQGFKF
jgi:hypothetical protein